MNDGFDDEQDSSQVPIKVTSRVLELNPQQNDIYRNLRYIGEEIAAFYLDGLKILQDDNLQTGAYLLAHVAREIDGGLRDILSSSSSRLSLCVVGRVERQRNPTSSGISPKKILKSTFKVKVERLLVVHQD